MVITETGPTPMPFFLLTITCLIVLFITVCLEAFYFVYLILIFVCLTLGMTKLRDFFPKSLSAMSLLDDRGFLRVPGSDSKNRFDNVQLAILYRVSTVSSPLYRHLLPTGCTLHSTHGDGQIVEYILCFVYNGGGLDIVQFVCIDRACTMYNVQRSH